MTFRANLAQLDARYDWTGGHLLGAVGRAWYDDDDTAADNGRPIDFHHLEAQQSLGGRFYGAVRYSRIEADQGYPLVGHGTFSDLLFGTNFTDHIWRVGLGLGYDPAENLRLKVEYTWERGRLTNGQIRDETDQLAAEAGVKF
jgi:opacity protein-like surface antigen